MRGTAAEQKRETIHVAASAEWAGNGGRVGASSRVLCSGGFTSHETYVV